MQPWLLAKHMRTRSTQLKDAGLQQHHKPRCACRDMTYPTSMVRMTGWAHESAGLPSGCGAPQLLNSTPNGKRAASFTMCRYCISSCRAWHHSQEMTACKQKTFLLLTVKSCRMAKLDRLIAERQQHIPDCR